MYTVLCDPIGVSLYDGMYVRVSYPIQESIGLIVERAVAMKYVLDKQAAAAAVRSANSILGRCYTNCCCSTDPQ